MSDLQERLAVRSAAGKMSVSLDVACNTEVIPKLTPMQVERLSLFLAS